MNPRFPTVRTTTLHSLLLFALALFGLFSPTATQAAQVKGTYAYYWSLTFDYENNFNGLLQVVVGKELNGGVQNPPLATANFTVPCQRVGDVGLAGGAALFNGGYLTCTLDLKSALQTAVAQCNAVERECNLTIADVERYRSFRLLANMTSTAVGNAPLFDHPSARYTITPATSQAQVAAALTRLPALQSAAMPALLGMAQSYQARYQCGPFGGCAMDFAIGATTQNVPLGNQAVQFLTPPATIYVGYDPATNTSMPVGTQLAHLFIDPPNLGNN